MAEYAGNHPLLGIDPVCRVRPAGHPGCWTSWLLDILAAGHPGCWTSWLLDILAFGHRRSMWIMDVVWPLTVLYWGPLGLAFYWIVGRQSMDRKRMWQFTFGGATHCGAGCALGDFNRGTKERM
jgi:hypothetical protein